MISRNVYEHYFEKKKRTIENIIMTLINANKIIAIWGAGQRGVAFLNVFDSQNEKIKFVFDKNEEKYNTTMHTGHPIVDYHTTNADIVFVMNNAYEMEIKELLIDANKSADVINIDNVILGDLDVKETLMKQEISLTQVRKVKVAAVAILYNPTMDVYDNVITYANDVDITYIYDNSEITNKTLIEKLQTIENLIYISNSGNAGLAKPINIIAQKARNAGIDWLLTFDQDSQAETHMIKRMVQFAESEMCNERVGIIAPNISHVDNVSFDHYYTFFDKVFQSGAMHNLEILNKVGGYDEKLFIDPVDYEYCVRMRLNGYVIIKINHAFLKHNLQDDDVEYRFINGKKIIINKYSSARYYYICRNNLYLYDKYKLLDPVFARECEDNIMKIKNNAEIDVDSERHKMALEKAFEDYKNGVMGKLYNGEEI